MSSFDVLMEQGKWREFDKVFKVALELAGRDKEDFSTKSALDLGCGIGASTRALAKLFGRVVGVDADNSLLERARSANAFISEGKKITYDQAELLQEYDAYGEQFDFVFSAYTLAYLGDVSKVLRHWASLVKPGGLLVVMEIQGLFAIHHPLGNFRQWFENFDKDVLGKLGYNSKAGIHMAESAQNIPELKINAFIDWQDAELAFNGPIQPGSHVWLAWENRWKRLWPFMSQSGNLEEGLHDAFFGALSSPDHQCDKDVKLLVCTKSTTSPKIPTGGRLKEDELDADKEASSPRNNDEDPSSGEPADAE